MKIWWPWRGKKLVLSLFEGRIPRSYEGPRVEPFRMAPRSPYCEDRHPKNARGPFYVVHGWCMACGYPQVLAPDLIAPVEDQRDHHCYFKKQPETPQEIEQAIKALVGSCCGAFRYAGSDEAIRKRLREAGEGDAIVLD